MESAEAISTNVVKEADQKDSSEDISSNDPEAVEQTIGTEDVTEGVEEKVSANKNLPKKLRGPQKKQPQQLKRLHLKKDR